MTLDTYLHAIQQLQIQIRSLDQPIDCKLLRAYANVVAQAKRAYPKYFSDWQVGVNYGSANFLSNEPLGLLFSHSASPFK